MTLVGSADGGYDFENWTGTYDNTLATTTASTTYAINANDAEAGVVDLTANFTSKLVPITITINTGGTDNSSTADGSYPIGTVINLKTTIDADYLFIDWTKVNGSGSILNFDAVNATYTITVTDAISGAQIDFDANFELSERTVTFKTTTDGIDFTSTHTTVLVKVGQSISSDAGATMPVPPNNGAGYTFVRWNDAEDGSGTNFTNLTVVVGNITVNAIFTANITYDAQGGSGHIPTVQAVQLNTTITTLATDPTLAGYAFEGWFTQISGGTEAQTTDVVNEPITLYAQWSQEYWTDHAVQPAGNGLIGTPYEIYTANELAWIARETNLGTSWSVGVYVRLYQNINLFGYRWEPIGDFNTGTTTSAFSGNFNADNFDIANMLIDEQELNQTKYLGLFGYANGTILDNVRIKAATITVNNSSTTADTYIGGLVGYNTDNLVKRSHTAGVITATTANNLYVGGLIGYSLGATSQIQEGAGVMTITATAGTITNDANVYVGGLVGYSDAGNILNAYSQGNITAKTLYVIINRAYVGGLVGYQTGASAKIERAYSFNTISLITTAGGFPSNKVGNLVGYLNSSTIDGAYYSDGLPLFGQSGVGDIDGGAIVSASEETYADLRIQGTYTSWNFDGIWMMDTINIANNLPILKGVGHNAIEVSSSLHGTITPNVTIITNGIITQLYSFNPEAGYDIDIIEIDGVALEGVEFTNAVNSSEYQFTNLRGYSSIYVHFVFESIIAITSSLNAGVDNKAVGFIKITDGFNNSWLYPLNGIAHNISVFEPTNYTVKYILPTNHAVASNIDAQSNTFELSSNTAQQSIDVVVSKTTYGYVYDMESTS